MNKTAYQHIIIGAGFSGLGMAIKLRQAGMDDILILERNDEIGGTWYDNAYPGAACDVESHLYSFSFEPNPEWSRQFGPQQEILSYMKHCAKKYDLNKLIRLNTTVSKAAFDEASGLWHISTDKGEAYTAPYLISCSGGLSEPSFPNIKGLQDFKGKMFHTARWDHSYDLSGKSVAVIGTGASAIQVVPAIVPLVGHLDLFQRTAPWVIQKADKPISGFRRWMYENIPFTRSLYRFRLYWVHEVMAIGFVVNPTLLKLFGKIAIRYLNRTVKDETLRKKLTPNYVIGCKRILMSNDYYPALQKPNVSVITEAIDHVNETGIVTKDGMQHKTDAIIIATGFQAAEGVLRFEVKGLGGKDLNNEWRTGAEAYLGTSVAGFPNMFLVVGPNTGLGHSSMLLMIEAQVNYIMQCLAAMKKRNAKYASVKADTQQKYNEQLQSDLTKSVWQSGGCHSWYQMSNGKNVTLYPGFTFSFMKRTAKFEAEKYDWVA